MIDPALLTRARDGDPAAMRSLLLEAAPTVQRFATRLCPGAADAEDAQQDALYTLTTQLPQYEGRAAFTSWLYTLVRTACGRRRRGLKHQPHAPEEALEGTAAPGPSPEEHAAGAELRTLVGAALDAMSAEHRAVILLRDVEGLSAAEAAAALGLSVEALKSRLHRARSALREALRPAVEPPLPAAPDGCPDVAARLSEKLEGDLAPVDCAAMEAHLARCPRCDRACASLRAALAQCAGPGTAPVDADTLAAVESALAAWQRARAAR